MTSLLYSLKNSKPFINVNSRHNVLFSSYMSNTTMRRWKEFLTRKTINVGRNISGYYAVDFSVKSINEYQKFPLDTQISSYMGNPIQEGLPSDKVADDIYLITPMFSGKYREYYDDGNVQLEISYRNGMREGKSVEYYKEGSPWRIFQYKDDKPIGKSIWHYPQGNLQAEIEFDGNSNVGYIKIYDYDDNIVMEGYVVETDNCIVLQDIVSNNIYNDEEIIEKLNEIIDHEADVELNEELELEEDEIDEDDDYETEVDIKPLYNQISIQNYSLSNISKESKNNTKSKTIFVQRPFK
jgi:antitoxin component YwqK of YwqJK toxin-antitoxin module